MTLALIPLLAFVFDPKSVPAPLRYECTAFGTRIPAGLYRGAVTHKLAQDAYAGKQPPDDPRLGRLFRIQKANFAPRHGFTERVDIRIGRDRRIELNGLPIAEGEQIPGYGPVTHINWKPDEVEITFSYFDLEAGTQWSGYFLIWRDDATQRVRYSGSVNMLGLDLCSTRWSDPLDLVQPERLR
ncbi:MAG: hypothetical protein SF069_04690 [Phycisphaerae bacterium]|nr:hypothetical protein [Phycisphaerae bacterium]